MKQCRSINTHLTAVDSNMPSIAFLKKHVGEETIQAYIEMWIINLLSFVNVGKTMNDSQVFETAMMIIYEYPQLNIADINLVFKMAKLGKMGAFYDRLDGQVILTWFEKYFAERCSICADRSVNESVKYKGENIEGFDKVCDKFKIKKII